MKPTQDNCKKYFLFEILDSKHNPWNQSQKTSLVTFRWTIEVDFKPLFTYTKQ